MGRAELETDECGSSGGMGGKNDVRDNLQWEEKIKMQADLKGKKQHKSTREQTERGRGLTEREKMMFSLEQIM